MDDGKHHDPERAYSGGSESGGKPGHSDRENRGREAPPTDEEIAAYVSGEMTPGEAAAFERRLDSDEALGREVEEWREAIAAAEEWAGEEAPGVERVGDLPVPSLPSPGACRRLRSRLLPAGLGIGFRSGWVTAGVFVAGFLLGALVFGGGFGGIGGAPEEPGGTTVSVTSDGSESEPSEEGTGQIGPSENNEPGEGTRLANRAPARYATQEDGRVVVETTLAKSGARVVMVVDGEFRIGDKATGGRTQ